jgi:hypothetical protein
MMKDRPSHQKPISIRFLSFATVLLLPLASACQFVMPSGPTGSDPSLEQEKIQLAIQQTQLAMDIQAATLAAQSQVQQPTQPLAPTQPPPPTSAPPPTAEQPSVEQPTAEQPSVEIPSGEEPVEGSLTRAPYDPAASYGPPTVSDTFDGKTGLFAAQSDGPSRSWYADGRYNLAFSSRGLVTWYWTDHDAANFYAEVVIRNGDQCVDWDRAGMIIRGERSSGLFGNASDIDFGYLMGITCGGAYFMAVTGGPGNMGWICYIWEGGTSWDCNTPMYLPSEYIDTGPGAYNRLGVLADGGEFNLYINGHYVDRMNEWTFWGTTNWGAWSNARGQFALFLGPAQKPNGTVSFEEFNQWSMP